MLRLIVYQNESNFTSFSFACNGQLKDILIKRDYNFTTEVATSRQLKLSSKIIYGCDHEKEKLFW